MTTANPLRIARLLLLLTALASPVGSIQAESTLEAEARRYLMAEVAPSLPANARLEIELAPLDSRLRQGACSRSLAFAPLGRLRPGAFTLKARCPTESGWTLYLRGELRVFQPVVVSRVPLPRGSILSPRQLKLEERELSRLRQGYYGRIAPLVDAQVKQDLPADTPLQPRQLQPPLLVRRDDRVTIRARAQGLRVETRGTALEDGRRNEQIRVRNDRSGRVIKARVAERGLVELP